MARQKGRILRIDLILIFTYQRREELPELLAIGDVWILDDPLVKVVRERGEVCEPWNLHLVRPP